MADLQGQTLISLNNLTEQSRSEMSSLQEEIAVHQNIMQIRNNMNTQEEQTRLMTQMINGINRIQNTVTEQALRFDSLEWKVESISRQMKEETVSLVSLCNSDNLDFASRRSQRLLPM